MALSFDTHVRRALDSLPPEIAEGLENVAVGDMVEITFSEAVAISVETAAQ